MLQKLLDANGRMARAAAGGAGGDAGGVGSGVTGRWSLYKESDNELGAMLRQFCEDEELVAGRNFEVAKILPL
eukprot:SAG31_NODE_9574_length_1256_cov_18.992221_1_plen_73_part_00